MKRWRVVAYFPVRQDGSLVQRLDEQRRVRRMGIEVSRDKGEMRRRLRSLRSGTPKAWGWRYALEIVPMLKESEGGR